MVTYIFQCHRLAIAVFHIEDNISDNLTIEKKEEGRKLVEENTNNKKAEEPWRLTSPRNIFITSLVFS